MLVKIIYSKNILATEAKILDVRFWVLIVSFSLCFVVKKKLRQQNHTFKINAIYIQQSLYLNSPIRTADHPTDEGRAKLFRYYV